MSGTPEQQEAKAGLVGDVNGFLKDLHAAREAGSIAIGDEPLVTSELVTLPTEVTATEVEWDEGTNTAVRGWDLERKPGLPIKASDLKGRGVTLIGDGVSTRLRLQAVLPRPII